MDETIVPKFTELTHSTGSVKFRLTNVNFRDEKLIKRIQKLRENADAEFDILKANTISAQILKIGCNFGEVILPGYKERVTKPPTTNRGRKRSKGNKNKRKVQGTGKYFNSQLTFEVKLNLTPFEVYTNTKKRKIDLNSYELDKKDRRDDGEYRVVSYIYKVKIFRNGKGQIPGLRTEDESEIRKVLKPIKNFFSMYFGHPVRATDFYRFIQNYKSEIIGDYEYEIQKLQNFFKSLDNGEYPKRIFRVKASTHSKLLVYFNTPIEQDKKKTTNLTIYRKGSINIDGAINRESADRILKYFKNVLKKHNNFLYDPDAVSTESSSIESSESDEEKLEESSSGSSWSD
jgi:TATA-box binding protein (TBP) (component of TFIID and TFIIIB)